MRRFPIVPTLLRRAAARRRASTQFALRHCAIADAQCASPATDQNGLRVEAHGCSPPFGLTVTACAPEALFSVSKFIIDDGAGHAFAFRVGEFTLVSFRLGAAEMISAAAFNALVCNLRHGMKAAYVIPSQRERPDRQGRDSLCGGKGSCESKAPEELVNCMQQEAAAALHVVSDHERAGALRCNGLWHCPLCPF